MDHDTKLVTAASEQKFMLDELISVKRSASGDHWIVKVHKWYIGGTVTHPETGIDKSKVYTYRATIEMARVMSNRIVFTEET